MRYGRKRRVELAKQGLAVAITNDAGEILDGSCPIASKTDLVDAIQNFGRLGNKSAVRAHIISRAEALGALELLPAGWASKAGSKRRGRPVDSVSLGKAVSSDRSPRKRGRPPGSVSLTAEKANEIILLLRGGARWGPNVRFTHAAFAQYSLMSPPTTRRRLMSAISATSDSIPIVSGEARSIPRCGRCEL